MKRIVVGLLLVTFVAPVAGAGVFQYRIEESYQHKGKTRTRLVFLWIPPEAKQVRGVAVCGMTLMEREFVRDPIIRKACREEQIALVFSTGGIGRVDIQKTLDRFARESGYRELSTAPLMFVGHSAGGPPSHRMARKYAERCFALVQYRGGVPWGGDGLPQGVPSLAMVGQFDEFGGTMRDANGNEPAWQRARDGLAGLRRKNPDALVTLVVEPGAGHFAWSERNAKYLAKWMSKAADARIPETWEITTDTPPTLKTLDAGDGWLVSLDLKKIAETDPAKPAKYDGDKGDTMWVFDKQMAEATVKYHQGMGGKDQFIRWKDRYWVDAGTRYFFLGMKWVGPRTFEVHPVYAEKVPTQHKGRGPKWASAGQSAGHSEVPIKVKPVSGPIVRAGTRRLRIEYDALTPAGARSRATFMAYSEGDDTYRYTEQVGMMPRGFRGLRKGKKQTITFPEIKDVSADTKPFELKATSDADLPIQYYVAEGPAVVTGGKLHITQIPRRAKFPIEVTVVAAQFGSAVEPKVKTAKPVRRSFKITSP
jgi:hypothetical protein